MLTGLKIRTIKSKVMVLDWKKVACPLSIGGGVQVSWGLFLEWGTDGAWHCQINLCRVCSDAVAVTVVVKNEPSSKAKLLIYCSRLGAHLQHCSALLLLHVEFNNWGGSSICYGCLLVPPWGGATGTSCWEEPQGRPSKCWRDYISLSLGTPQGPPRRVGGGVWTGKLPKSEKDGWVTQPWIVVTLCWHYKVTSTACFVEVRETRAETGRTCKDHTEKPLD